MYIYIYINIFVYIYIYIYIYIHAYFKKLWKNNASSVLISEHPVRTSNKVRVREALYGDWWCDLPRDFLGKISNYLKIFKAENS